MADEGGGLRFEEASGQHRVPRVTSVTALADGGSLAAVSWSQGQAGAFVEAPKPGDGREQTSQDGMLLAVMERGAGRFFADLPDLDRRPGHPARAQDSLARAVSATTQTLERHPDFLRLLIVFAVQPPTAGEGEIQAVVRRIREHALELLRDQIAVAFGDDPRSPITGQLARFALAAIDGAFVASQADRGATLGHLLQPLAPSLAAARRALQAAS